jgi:hypothetical protein
VGPSQIFECGEAAAHECLRPRCFTGRRTFGLHLVTAFGVDTVPHCGQHAWCQSLQSKRQPASADESLLVCDVGNGKQDATTNYQHAPTARGQVSRVITMEQLTKCSYDVICASTKS